MNNPHWHLKQEGRRKEEEKDGGGGAGGEGHRIVCAPSVIPPATDEIKHHTATIKGSREPYKPCGDESLAIENAEVAI